MLNTNAIQVDRIALFAHAASAQAFLDEVFPWFCHCLVVSADGVFPRDESLKARAQEELASNKKIKIIVFGATALKKMNVTSERFVVMDDLLMQDLKSHQMDRALGLDFSPPKLANFMENFFSQWDRLQRMNDSDFAYKNFAEYKKELFDWRADLVTDNSSNTSEA